MATDPVTIEPMMDVDLEAPDVEEEPRSALSLITNSEMLPPMKIESEPGNDLEALDWDTLKKTELHEQQDATRTPIDDGFIRQRLQSTSWALIYCVLKLIDQGRIRRVDTRAAGPVRSRLILDVPHYSRFDVRLSIV